jgi:FkbM family methyltransferase
MSLMNIKRAILGVLEWALPPRAKVFLFHLGFNLAPEEFARFSYEYALAPNMRFGLAAAANRGLRPKTIVDIGAFEGSWASLAHSVWPEAQLIMIDPNRRRELNATAERLGAALHYELLGAKDGMDVEFYVMDSGSSVFSERSPLSRTTVTRNVRTLDSLVKNLDAPVFLKLDAQGYEVEILRGANETLKSVNALLLEVSLIEVNNGAPLLNEVVAFVGTLGFVAYDILEFHRRPLDRALNQIDVLFVRPSSSLLADKRHFA